MIKNFSRFCRFAHSHGKICPNCLKYCNNDEAYKAHSNICFEVNKNGPKVNMRGDDNWYTEFKDHAKCYKAPVLIYADTESVLEKVNSPPPLIDTWEKYIWK